MVASQRILNDSATLLLMLPWPAEASVGQARTTHHTVELPAWRLLTRKATGCRQLAAGQHGVGRLGAQRRITGAVVGLDVGPNVLVFIIHSQRRFGRDHHCMKRRGRLRGPAHAAGDIAPESGPFRRGRLRGSASKTAILVADN